MSGRQPWGSFWFHAVWVFEAGEWPQTAAPLASVGTGGRALMAVNHRAEVVKSVCLTGPFWSAWRGRRRGPERRIFPADARHKICAKPPTRTWLAWRTGRLRGCNPWRCWPSAQVATSLGAHHEAADLISSAIPHGVLVRHKPVAPQIGLLACRANSQKSFALPWVSAGRCLRSSIGSLGHLSAARTFGLHSGAFALTA